MTRKYIRCCICGKSVAASEETITCSKKCASEWLNRITRAQHANIQKYGKEPTPCRMRKSASGRSVGVLCGETDPAVCKKCGWNPRVEAARIRAAKKSGE